MFFPETVRGWEEGVSRFLQSASLLLLIFAVKLITWLLVISWISGDWPFKYWNDWPMNHGPWWYDKFDFTANPRRHILGDGLILIFLSNGLSFISMLFKFCRFTCLLFAANLLVFWLSVYFLIWLID